MGPRAIYKGMVITKAPKGFKVGEKIFKTLTMATTAIDIKKVKSKK